jgi:outer membrane protein assembly factor BamB
MKLGLVFGIVFVVIVSSITSMAVRYNIETSERNNVLEELVFVCNDDSPHSSRPTYYKKHLQHDSASIDNEVEGVKMTTSAESSQTTTNGGLMDSPWPMSCHDLHHTSRSPYSTANNPGVEKWRFEADSWVDSGMVIDNDGIIYFGDQQRLFYAINPDGSLKWKTSLGGRIWSTPALGDDGTVYIGAWDDNLYAINPDGAMKWKFLSKNSISSSPAVAEDGTIYFGTLYGLGTGGQIYAVNPDGTEKWQYQTEYHITSDPAIGDDDTVYIGGGDGYLYALYPNGTLRWRFKTGDEIHGHPSIAEDGTIYIGSYDDYLYALNPDGTLKWKFDTYWGTSGNPAIGKDDTIFVGSNKLYAINPDSSLKWSFDLGPERHIAHSSPAISADGTIYVGTNIGETAGGEIIAVNSDSTEKWRKMIADEWVWSAPCIGEDGTVYIGSSSDRQTEPDDWDAVGYLHAFGKVESNEPPDTPTIIGKLKGRVGRLSYYYVSTIDPDRNPVYFYIDWDDGSNSGWIGPYASGEEVYVEHIWSQQGTYIIRAKAKDEFGGESDWAELSISMPKSKLYKDRPLLESLQSLMEHFPLLARLLQLPIFNRLLNLR